MAKPEHSPRPLRLAYLVTHPIQYQVPLLRRITELGDIDFHVFFQSPISIKPHHDNGFGRVIEWDVPLLDGYAHTFLPIAIGKPDRVTSLLPINKGLVRRLKREGFDAIWIHGYSRPYGLYVGVMARLMGMAVFIRDDVHRMGKRRRPLHELGKRAVLSLSAALGFHFLAIGSANDRFYRELGVPSKNITMMPYAVDNAWFQKRLNGIASSPADIKGEIGIDDNAPIILYAGKFQPWKRPGDLLSAYQSTLQDLRRAGQSIVPWLLYAGSGSELDAIREVAKGHDRVKFFGFQNQRQLANLFALCDIFVLPSSKEPWGLVVNEVMNAGKAVIVTDECGCAEDLVFEEKNGFVYPSGDVGVLSALLTRLCSDLDLCRVMGQKSLDIINSWDFEADILALKEALRKVVPEKMATMPLNSGFGSLEAARHE